jgi:hypothetical protein
MARGATFRQEGFYLWERRSALIAAAGKPLPRKETGLLWKGGSAGGLQQPPMLPFNISNPLLLNLAVKRNGSLL